jgi:DNA-binding MarR family transcriptional regulator
MREQRRAVPKELDDATLGAWRSFLRGHALMVRRIEAALAAEGLPPLGWYDVLWAVRGAPEGKLRIRELADAIVLSPTGMSRMVERLVQAGLLRREAVAGDRRGAYAAITDAGVEQLRAMWPVYARVVREHFEPNVQDPHALEATLAAVAGSAARR